MKQKVSKHGGLKYGKFCQNLSEMFLKWNEIVDDGKIHIVLSSNEWKPIALDETLQFV